MKKRIFSLLVVLCMLIACVPVMVYAETQSGNVTADGTITWSLENGVLTISGTGAMPNYSATTDEPWNAHRAEITSVVIGDGITHIGERSFQECTALTIVTMADSVTSMGPYVFNACTSLTTVKLSENLENLPNGTFNNAKKIMALEIPYKTTITNKSNNDVALRSVNTALVLTVYEGSAAHTWAASSGTPNVTPVIYKLNKGLSYVVKKPGGNVTDDGSITWSLENGVLTISGTGAMPDYADTTDEPWNAYRASITSAVIGDGITYIGSRAFQECTALTTVTMADSVVSMGTYVFNSCGSLNSVTLSENLVQIPNGTFNGASALLSLEIPFKTAIINDSDSKSSFRGASRSLNLIVYAGSLAHTWAKSSGVDGVTPTIKKLNATLTYTEKDVTAGGDVSSDGSITWEFRNGVLTISGTGAMPSWHTTAGSEADAYYYTNRSWHEYAGLIEKVVIGNGITAVGEYSFFGCNKLAEVEFAASSTLKTIDEYAFANTILREVNVPASVVNIEANAFRASSEANTDTHTLEKLVVNGDYTLFMPNAMGQNALNRQSKVVIYCNYGSEAMEFSQANNIDYRLMDTDYYVESYADKTAKVLNSTNATKTAKVVFANYNDDGSLSDSSIVDTTLNVGMNSVNAKAGFADTGDVNIFLWENGTLVPITRAYKSSTLWMIGDSIMAPWGEGRFPQEGWGEGFKKVVKTDLKVENKAISGRRAENFYNNDWPAILNEVKAGDFVMVSFLHNDYCWVADSSKNNGLYQDANYINTYKSYIEKFVYDCEAKGAQIILVVPPNRGTSTNFHSSLVDGVEVGDYSAVIPDVAAAKGVPCVNLHSWTLANNTSSSFVDSVYLSKGYLNGLVADGVMTETDLNNHTNSNVKNNRDDKTHISVNGCELVAEFVAAQLKAMNTGIENYLK